MASGTARSHLRERPPGGGRPARPAAPYAATRLRAWRRYRGLTLRQLADAINAGQPEPVTSYASIARIEQGLQPYSQPILEAAAGALGVSPATLLAHGPDESADVMALWAELDAPRRTRALALLKALKESP